MMTPNFRLLASICNSTIIEMCDDMIRISPGFRSCQMFRFIAGIKEPIKKVEMLKFLSCSSYSYLSLSVWSYLIFIAKVIKLLGIYEAVKHLFSACTGV